MNVKSLFTIFVVLTLVIPTFATVFSPVASSSTSTSLVNADDITNDMFSGTNSLGTETPYNLQMTNNNVVVYVPDYSDFYENSGGKATSFPDTEADTTPITPQHYDYDVNYIPYTISVPAGYNFITSLYNTDDVTGSLFLLYARQIDSSDSVTLNFYVYKLKCSDVQDGSLTVESTNRFTTYVIPYSVLGVTQTPTITFNQFCFMPSNNANTYPFISFAVDNTSLGQSSQMRVFGAFDVNDRYNIQMFDISVSTDFRDTSARLGYLFVMDSGVPRIKVLIDRHPYIEQDLVNLETYTVQYPSFLITHTGTDAFNVPSLVITDSVQVITITSGVGESSYQIGLNVPINKGYKGVLTLANQGIIVKTITTVVAMTVNSVYQSFTYSGIDYNFSDTAFIKSNVFGSTIKSTGTTIMYSIATEGLPGAKYLISNAIPLDSGYQQYTSAQVTSAASTGSVISAGQAFSLTIPASTNEEWSALAQLCAEGSDSNVTTTVQGLATSFITSVSYTGGGEWKMGSTPYATMPVFTFMDGPSRVYLATLNPTNSNIFQVSTPKYGSDFYAYFVPNSGYAPPDTITVTIGGNSTTLNASTTSIDGMRYSIITLSGSNQFMGEIYLDATVVTGNITIVANCIPYTPPSEIPISTWDDLYLMSNSSETFYLTNDIVAPLEWDSIPRFQGIFYGQGHTITLGTSFPNPYVDFGKAYGLFGILDGALVRDLTIVLDWEVNLNLAGDSYYVGALAGVADASTITNVRINPAQSSSDGINIATTGGASAIRVGGLIGYAFSNSTNTVEIINCSSSISVTCDAPSTSTSNYSISVGGFIGWNNSSATAGGEISNSFCGTGGQIISCSGISTQMYAAGGLVGNTVGGMNILNCSVNVRVVEAWYMSSNSMQYLLNAGGLIGYADLTTTGNSTLTNNYVSSQIQTPALSSGGSGYIGGIIGNSGNPGSNAITITVSGSIINVPVVWISPDVSTQVRNNIVGSKYNSVTVNVSECTVLVPSRGAWDNSSSGAYTTNSYTSSVAGAISTYSSIGLDIGASSSYEWGMLGSQITSSQYPMSYAGPGLWALTTSNWPAIHYVSSVQIAVRETISDVIPIFGGPSAPVTAETMLRNIASGQIINGYQFNPGSTYKLFQNITITGGAWRPIQSFSGGTFDGQSYTIGSPTSSSSNINIVSLDSNANGGMFGSVNNATFKNMILYGSITVSTTNDGQSTNAGILAAIANGNTIVSRVYVSGTIDVTTNNTTNLQIHYYPRIGGMFGSNLGAMDISYAGANVEITQYNNSQPGLLIEGDNYLTMIGGFVGENKGPLTAENAFAWTEFTVDHENSNWTQFYRYSIGRFIGCDFGNAISLNKVYTSYVSGSDNSIVPSPASRSPTGVGTDISYAGVIGAGTSTTLLSSTSVNYVPSANYHYTSGIENITPSLTTITTGVSQQRQAFNSKTIFEVAGYQFSDSVGTFTIQGVAPVAAQYPTTYNVNFLYSGVVKVENYQFTVVEGTTFSVVGLGVSGTEYTSQIIYPSLLTNQLTNEFPFWIGHAGTSDYVLATREITATNENINILLDQSQGYYGANYSMDATKGYEFNFSEIANISAQSGTYQAIVTIGDYQFIYSNNNKAQYVFQGGEPVPLKTSEGASAEYDYILTISNSNLVARAGTVVVQFAEPIPSLFIGFNSGSTAITITVNKIIGYLDNSYIKLEHTDVTDGDIVVLDFTSVPEVEGYNFMGWSRTLYPTGTGTATYTQNGVNFFVMGTNTILLYPVFSASYPLIDTHAETSATASTSYSYTATTNGDIAWKPLSDEINDNPSAVLSINQSWLTISTSGSEGNYTFSISGIAPTTAGVYTVVVFLNGAPYVTWDITVNEPIVLLRAMRFNSIRAMQIPIADQASLEAIGTNVTREIDGISYKFSATATYILTNDIVCDNLIPICYNPNNPFYGTLLGNGYTISYSPNVNVFTGNTMLCGIFGFTEGARISDLNVIVNEGSVLDSTSRNQWMGGVAAYSKYTSFENISIDGIMIPGGNISSIGGLIGVGLDNTINDVCSQVNISGTSQSVIGGIIGTANGDRISNVSSICNIDSEYIAGGIVGQGTAVRISDSYSQSVVSGWEYVGGIIGYIDNSTIARCYAVNTGIEGGMLTGGIIGYCNLDEPAVVTDCIFVDGGSSVYGGEDVSYYELATTTLSDAFVLPINGFRQITDVSSRMFEVSGRMLANPFPLLAIQATSGGTTSVIPLEDQAYITIDDDEYILQLNGGKLNAQIIGSNGLLELTSEYFTREGYICTGIEYRYRDMPNENSFEQDFEKLEFLFMGEDWNTSIDVSHKIVSEFSLNWLTVYDFKSLYDSSYYGPAIFNSKMSNPSITGMIPNAIPVTTATEWGYIGSGIVYNGYTWSLSASYNLMADIDISGIASIGSSSSPFTGSFDGNGHTITNNGSSISPIFSYVSSPTNPVLITDFVLNLTATDAVLGGVVGTVPSSGNSYNMEFSNIVLNGSCTTSASSKAAFLVSLNMKGLGNQLTLLFENITNNIDVNNYQTIGLFGTLEITSGTIKLNNVVNNGDFSLNGTHLSGGGVIQSISSNTPYTGALELENLYNFGNISAYSDSHFRLTVGGIISHFGGFYTNNNTIRMNNIVNVGNIELTYNTTVHSDNVFIYAGGIIGDLVPNTAVNPTIFDMKMTNIFSSGSILISCTVGSFYDDSQCYVGNIIGYGVLYLNNSITHGLEISNVISGSTIEGSFTPSFSSTVGFWASAIGSPMTPAPNGYTRNSFIFVYGNTSIAGINKSLDGMAGSGSYSYTSSVSNLGFYSINGSFGNNSYGSKTLITQSAAQQQSTFVGWDFVNTWAMPSNVPSGYELPDWLPSTYSYPIQKSLLVRSPITFDTTVSNGVATLGGEYYAGDINATINITPNAGYTYPLSVNVVMNGVTLTENNQYTYNSNTGIITIGTITGNISLTALCPALLNVTISITNGQSETVSGIMPSRNWSFNITTVAGYNLPSTLTILRGATTLIAGTDYSYNSTNGVLIIYGAAMTANITVNGSLVPKTYILTMDIEGGSYENASVPTFGQQFTVTLVSTRPFVLPPQLDSVKSGNINLTPYDSETGEGDYTYNYETGLVTILGSAVTGAIEISATCVTQILTVSYVVDNTLYRNVLVGYGQTAPQLRYQTESTGTDTWYTDTQLTRLYDFSTPVTASFSLYGHATTEVTVSYNLNGGSGVIRDNHYYSGTTGIPDTIYYDGSIVTVASPNFVSKGFIFNGFNTSSTGSGTAYRPGATFTAAADVVLYAQWLPRIGSQAPVQYVSTYAPMPVAQFWYTTTGDEKSITILAGEVPGLANIVSTNGILGVISNMSEYVADGYVINQKLASFSIDIFSWQSGGFTVDFGGEVSNTLTFEKVAANRYSVTADFLTHYENGVLVNSVSCYSTGGNVKFIYDASNPFLPTVVFSASVQKNGAWEFTQSAEIIELNTISNIYFTYIQMKLLSGCNAKIYQVPICTVFRSPFDGGLIEAPATRTGYIYPANANLVDGETLGLTENMGLNMKIQYLGNGKSITSPTESSTSTGTLFLSNNLRIIRDNYADTWSLWYDIGQGFIKAFDFNVGSSGSIVVIWTGDKLVVNNMELLDDSGVLCPDRIALPGNTAMVYSYVGIVEAQTRTITIFNYELNFNIETFLAIMIFVEMIGMMVMFAYVKRSEEMENYERYILVGGVLFEFILTVLVLIAL